MTQGQGGGTPAGWYPDPEGHGDRWWNGMSWGELREAAQAAQPAQAQQPYPPQQYDQFQQPGQAYGQQPQQQVPQPTQPAQQPAAQGMRCVHCQFTDFSQANFLLNTRGMALGGLDAFNAAANCLICRRCGFIHWFATG